MATRAEARRFARQLERIQAGNRRVMGRAVLVILRWQANRAAALIEGSTPPDPPTLAAEKRVTRRAATAVLNRPQQTATAVRNQELPPLPTLLPDEHAGILFRAVEPVEAAMVQASGELAALATGLEANPLVAGTEQHARIMREMAQRVTRINDTTRNRIRVHLIRGARAGENTEQIAARIQRAVGSRPRAQLIARTELGFASAESSARTYTEAGVEDVLIIDGPGCGWATHDDGDTADGSSRTVAEYQATPLAHPNCVRIAAPDVGL